MKDKRDECGCHRGCTTLPHDCADDRLEIIVEYAEGMSGGGMCLRNPHPEIIRMWPIDEWKVDMIRSGRRVYTRTIIIVEDWKEVHLT